MKLKAYEIDKFVANPSAKGHIVAALCYGPDHGLMKQRAEKLAKASVDNLDDPFAVITLTEDSLVEDAAALDGALNAFSMMGGRRLVWIKDGSNEAVPDLKKWLEMPTPDTFVIVEAGELPPKSVLRKLFEAAKNAAPLPCYVADEQTTAREISTILQEAGKRIAPDALQIMAAAVKGDRLRQQSEIEKLLLFIGDEPYIDVEHVSASVPDAGHINLDDCIYAMGNGDFTKAYTSYISILEDGMAFMIIIRSLQNHLRRLRYVQSLVNDEGQSAQAAMKQIHPPIFFKYTDAFAGQVYGWPSLRIDRCLEKLVKIETMSKKTGYPAETLLGQFLLKPY